MNNREFFNKLAHRWDEITNHDDGRIKTIMELSSVEKGSKILDIGTGTGILISYFLQTLPSSITAIDISENMISMAKKKYDDKRVKFVVQDIMEYKDSGFDYIFLYSAYPHFSDKHKLFTHLLTLVNKAGKIVIAHSMSKEKINEIHKKNNDTRRDSLPPVEATAQIMSNYFTVDKMIDNDDMYYISGIKA